MAAGGSGVATSQTYPQLVPGQVPNDKIVILEDTTGSGKADKSTVFADGLFIPNSVVPGDGGVYVTNSTEILHLKDTKGTGKADERRVVLAGFGTEDTHHIVHTLHWGPDGRLYFIQSIYIHSHLETPHGLKLCWAAASGVSTPDTLAAWMFIPGAGQPVGDCLGSAGARRLKPTARAAKGSFSPSPARLHSAVGYDKLCPASTPAARNIAGAEILIGRHDAR